MTIRTHRGSPAAALLAAVILLPGPGPLADEPAPPKELDDRISAVTVYSDQAAVTRSAAVRLEAGRHQVAFDPLPTGAWPATVQVVADGADIVAVEVLPPWPTPPGDEWAALQSDRSRLQAKLADLQPRYEALRQEAALLTSLGRHPVRKEGELGAALLATTRDEPVGRWQQARLDALGVEAEALRVAARALRAELRELERSMAPVTQDGRDRVVATLSVARASTVTLAATTRIGGPRWVPDYDLHLDPEGGVGRVGVNALVSQLTGEDWRGVPLRLSTATPGAAATLPKLTAWYLQEQAPPAPEPAMEYPEEEAAVMDEAPRRRRQSKKSSPAASSRRRAEAPADYGVYDTYEAEEPAREALGSMGGGGLSDVLRNRGDSSGYGASSPSRSPATRASVPPGPASGDLLMRLLGSPPSGEPVVSPPYVVVPPPSGPAVNWARFDPAQQAGGFDYAMSSAGDVDIPSDGVARRIPLLGLELPVRFEHRVPSAVQPGAWLYALLQQDGQAPLLSGEARVFQSGDLLGNTTLPMSARGATFEVPLGKDEQVRVERKVEELADRSGPLAGGESLTRAVTLTVRNLRPDAVRAVITDRVPVTWQDGMKVVVTQEPDPPATVGTDGLIRWTVDLAPGADVALTFSYLIRHPRNTALREQ